MLAGNIDKCTVEDLDLMYNTNVRSMFIITKQAIPHLEKTKGNCIEIFRSENFLEYNMFEVGLMREMMSGMEYLCL